MILFQFTTSQGGRQRYIDYVTGNSHFNSRPHKEVDQGGGIMKDRIVISIHDLTRRSTAFTSGNPAIDVISIHDLTRRSTDISPGVAVVFDISIHDLTRRSTFSESRSICLWIFQFTTSQGGRLLDPNIGPRRLYFNSRPHKEVDTLHLQ